MSLKPDAEVTIALATSAMAYGAYQMFLPSVADIRSLEPNNADIQASERTAAWIAAGMVGLVSVITHSPTVFMLGGATIIGTSWAARHADQVSTISKKAGSAVPAPAVGTAGVVGDEVSMSQQAATTPTYGVLV
jgi:hypothetical protein